MKLRTIPLSASSHVQNFDGSSSFQVAFNSCLDLLGWAPAGSLNVSRMRQLALVGFGLEDFYGVVELVDLDALHLVAFCSDSSCEFLVYFACVLYYSAGAEVDCSGYVALGVLLVEDGAEFVDAFV